MRYLRQLFAGFLRVRLTGLSPERFFNLCRAAGIELWNVSESKGEYRFSMAAGDFSSCRPLVRKAKVRLSIRKKCGLPFFLHKNRARKLWAAGFASFFLFLYLLSLFVWDIEYQGNLTYTDDQLSHYLETLNVRCGMRKHLISCENLESAIRNEFNGVTWVSLRLSGTRLYVHIKENDVPLTIPQRDESPCDLKAARGGVITSMVVRNGKAAVKPGDTVEKGQLLVSGKIPITDDGGTEVDAHYVRADADVVARVSRTEEKSIPLWHIRKEKTGRKRYGLYLNAAGHPFVWLFPNLWKTSWETAMEERQLRLAKDFYLPVQYGLIRSEEISVYEEKYDESELSRMALAYQNELTENLMQKGVHIIENNVKILISGSECLFRAELITEEPITEYAEPELHDGTAENNKEKNNQ